MFRVVCLTATLAAFVAASGCNKNDWTLSLDGSCHDVKNPDEGKAGEPVIFRSWQDYARGPDKSLKLLQERDVAPGEFNGFPYTPGVEAGPDVCGPTGHTFECPKTVELEEIPGIGFNLEFNARDRSNSLFSDAALTDDDQDGAKVPNARLSTMSTFFNQLFVHDVNLFTGFSIDTGVHGRANLSDASNPVVQTGIPVTSRFDLFNFAANPRGFPRPTHRVLQVSTREHTVVTDRNGAVKRVDWLNANSAWIDGSATYGVDAAALDKLRTKTDGKFILRDYQIGGFGPFPVTIKNVPPTETDAGLLGRTDPGTVPPGNEPFSPAFGDARGGQSMPLFINQLVWTRFHNLQADACAARHTGDEDIFQCARSRVVAALQKIIFSEMVPAFTGRAMSAWKRYKSYYDGQTSAEFILPVASLHSIVPAYLWVHKADGTPDARLQFPDSPGAENNPPGAIPFVGQQFGAHGAPAGTGSPLWYLALAGIPVGDGSLAEDPVAQMIRGMIARPAEEADEFLNDLQRNIPAGFGLDISALTAERDRLVGIPPYYKLRKHFLWGPARKIYGRSGCPKELENDPADDPVECFELVTGDAAKAAKLRDGMIAIGEPGKVKQISAFLGMSYESKAPGSAIGLVAQVIFEDAFKRYRDADRFYWEHRQTKDGDFKIEMQDLGIETLTYADVLRAVVDDPAGIPDQALLLPGNSVKPSWWNFWWGIGFGGIFVVAAGGSGLHVRRRRRKAAKPAADQTPEATELA